MLSLMIFILEKGFTKSVRDYRPSFYTVFCADQWGIPEIPLIPLVKQPAANCRHFRHF